ncbi:MAG: hypothetical protein RBJ76_04845 [Stenomitos frigidus ULC029]
MLSHFSLLHTLLQVGPGGLRVFDNNQNARDILGSAETASTQTSQAWDRTWDLALSGGLYHAVNNIGIFIAAGALIFWLLDFVKKWLSDEVSGLWVLQDLVWPLIVILFTANNGALMGGFSRGFRDTLNNFNAQVVQVVSAEQNMEKTLNELGTFSSVSARLATARGQCNTIVNNDKLVQCLKDQEAALQGILKLYQQEYGDTVKFKELVAQTQNSLRNPGEAIVDGAQSATIGVVNIALSPLMTAVAAFMAAMQYAFQQLIEVSMLLTALMGPLALGASLLPFGAKPIFAWLTAFWSLSVLKLSYNIIAGLTAIAIYQTSGTETLGSAIFFGLLSPILAMAMAAGGGMAVFSGILSATAAAGGFAVGRLSAGGGGGGAAEAASRQAQTGSAGRVEEA